MLEARRREWVLTDEGLYDLWKSTLMGLGEFLRLYRPTIDAVMGA